MNRPVAMHWILLHPPRFFHGVEGEPPLDSSSLTIRLADQRKPKPASEGNHQMKCQCSALRMVMIYYREWWTGWSEWSALSWKCQELLRIEIWPPLLWPYADHHLGAGQGVSGIIFDWDKEKEKQFQYLIIMCHILIISWHFSTQMGNPFNKAASTSLPAPSQQGDKQKLFSCC